MRWLGVFLLSVAGATLFPLYVLMASEPPDPAHPDPAWLGPATILWFAVGGLGTLLVIRADRRQRRRGDHREDPLAPHVA